MFPIFISRDITSDSLFQMWQLLAIGAVLISYLEARRVSVRPSDDDEEPTIHYYSAAEPQEGTEQRVVLVSAADQYNGLYGQPSAAPRLAQDNYIQQYRGAQPKAPRAKESPKQPPVQTIRNYNKVNDDGSFTFG